MTGDINWPIDLNRDRGLKVIIDLGKLPDCPGRRADIYHALQILRDNRMIEWIEWDRKGIG